MDKRYTAEMRRTHGSMVTRTNKERKMADRDTIIAWAKSTGVEIVEPRQVDDDPNNYYLNQQLWDSLDTQNYIPLHVWDDGKVYPQQLKMRILSPGYWLVSDEQDRYLIMQASEVKQWVLVREEEVNTYGDQFYLEDEEE